MLNECINDMIAYISFLRDKGITVCACEIEYLSAMGCDITGFYHTNPFCSLVKSRHEALLRCCVGHKAIMERLKNGEPFYGMCHAGMEENIFPLKTYAFGIVGFICVSGFCKNMPLAEARLDKISRIYGFNRKQLGELFASSVKPCTFSEEELAPLIAPLCAMFELLLTEINRRRAERDSAPGLTPQDILYSKITDYISINYDTRISVETAAEALHFSKSTISHVFNKKAGVSFPEYVNSVRMKKAAELLKKTCMSVSEVAFSTGFCDSNYFSSAFAKAYGLPPVKWRKG